MPIYEFRCLKCNEVFELLFLSTDDEKEMKCASCGGEDLERVMSTTNFNMKSTSSGAAGTTASQRNCGTGSCTTIEIPGRGD